MIVRLGTEYNLGRSEKIIACFFLKVLGLWEFGGTIWGGDKKMTYF